MFLGQQHACILIIAKQNYVKIVQVTVRIVDTHVINMIKT